jgi:threonine/homoserine/homoserine lactone efflux protein
MAIEHFWVFALAALLLNLTPGNDMLYVAARSTSQGIKAGIISSLGIMAGCMVHILAAVIGLSAIIAQSRACIQYH